MSGGEQPPSRARFATPTANITSISAQQQPTQKAPWRAPSRKPPRGAALVEAERGTAPGWRHLSRQASFSARELEGAGERKHGGAEQPFVVVEPGARSRPRRARATSKTKASSAERRPDQRVAAEERRPSRRRGGAGRPTRLRTAARAAGSTAASSPRSSPATRAGTAAAQPQRRPARRSAHRGGAPPSAPVDLRGDRQRPGDGDRDDDDDGTPRDRAGRADACVGRASRSRQVLRVDELPVGLDRVATVERPDEVVLRQVRPAGGRPSPRTPASPARWRRASRAAWWS